MFIGIADILQRLNVVGFHVCLCISIRISHDWSGFFTKPLIEVEGRCRSDVAFWGISVLPLHTSLSVCNRNTSLSVLNERNTEAYPTLSSKELCESIRHKARLFAEDIILENNINTRIHPTSELPTAEAVGFLLQSM